MSTMTMERPCSGAQTDETDFEARLVRALNDAGMLLMLSIGHRSGLLSAMADGSPLDSQGLAERTGLQERYVREWLGAMVAAGVVDLDPVAATYVLPSSRAELLTHRGPANLAVYAQFLPLLGAVEDDVLHCFRHGGGVPYSRYKRFHEVMAEDSGQTVLPALFDHILPLAPEIPGRLESGIRVADMGCGRGRALLMLARRYPRSRFIGYDLSAEAIAWATDEARAAGCDNLRFEVRDLSDLDQTIEPGSLDLVLTFDAIHDQARPLAVLTGIRRGLADDGVYLAQDIHASSHQHENVDHPLGAFLYAISCTHCMTVSLAQGGEGLGTMWGRQVATDYMRRAGFSHVEVRRLEHDIQNDYFICRP